MGARGCSFSPAAAADDAVLMSILYMLYVPNANQRAYINICFVYTFMYFVYI